MNKFRLLHMMAVVVVVSHTLQSGTCADEMSNLAATNFGQSIHPRIESGRMLRVNNQSPDAVDEERGLVWDRISRFVSKAMLPKWAKMDLKTVKTGIASSETHKLIRTKKFNPEKKDELLRFLFDFKDVEPSKLKVYLKHYKVKGWDDLVEQQREFKFAMNQVTGGGTLFDAAQTQEAMLVYLAGVDFEVKTLKDIARASELADQKIPLGHTSYFVDAKTVTQYRKLLAKIGKTNLDLPDAV